MSDTLATVRDHIRALMGVHNPEEFADLGLGTRRLNRMVEDEALELAGKTFGELPAITTVTLVAAQYDYPLTFVNIASIVQVLSNLSGRDIKFLPFAVFNARFRQPTAVGVPGNLPIAYTSWESTAGVAQLRVGPTPTAPVSDTLKVYTRTLPVAFTADSDTLPFSPTLTRALEYRVAARLAAVLSSERLARCGLSPNAYAEFSATGQSLLRAENFRMAGVLGRSDTVLRTGG